MSEQHRYQHQCNADLPTRIVLRKEGAEQERERIIKLWGQEMACNCEDSMSHLIELIKGEN